MAIAKPLEYLWVRSSCPSPEILKIHMQHAPNMLWPLQDALVKNLLDDTSITATNELPTHSSLTDVWSSRAEKPSMVKCAPGWAMTQVRWGTRKPVQMLWHHKSQDKTVRRFRAEFRVARCTVLASPTFPDPTWCTADLPHCAALRHVVSASSIDLTDSLGGF